MELLGLDPALFALFVSFGFMVGVFFGFFGMGGSFLVTPALLILGYPAPVAIGSSMAFVFGTAVIATIKHSDIGQVDYKLGALMFVGIALGIEVG
ncbi:MAG: TSUP family transporter, partial [Natrialbaceae archaeon]